jgi:hypothetical protein
MRIFAALLALFVMIASPALAHQPRTGPNGGLLVDAGTAYHVELVADGSETVTLFLFDAADQPIDSAGFKATAILIVNSKPARFPMESAGGQKLTGKAPGPVAAGVKGAVQLTAPDGSTAQAKF